MRAGCKGSERRRAEVRCDRIVRGTHVWKALGVLCLMLVGGCGSDGSSSVTVVRNPTPPAGVITGIVRAPGGVIAAPRLWWNPRLAWSLVEGVAVALQGVQPVGAGVTVSLSALDAADFADGKIDRPLPLVVDTVTEANGRYTIMDAAADDVTSCRKMVTAGTGTAMMRALVFQREVPVDSSTEALVRVLLDYVAGTTAHLCDFDAAELVRLQQKVADVVFAARGNSVEELNTRAYDLARTNRSLRLALDEAAR